MEEFLFICIVSRYEALDLNQIKQTACDLSQFVPLTYEDIPLIWMSAKNRVCVMRWKRHDGGNGAEESAHSKNGLLVLDGYVTDKAKNETDASAVLRRASRKGGAFTISSSPGGVAAFCWVASEDAVFAWNTMPAARGVYYATDRRKTVIGSRPLLVHLAQRESRYPVLTDRDIDVRLASGSLLTHGTFFEGVQRVQPRSALAVGVGGAQQIDYPLSDNLPIFSPKNENALAEELTQALMSSVRPFAKATILMSGGKDSRTVTAAAYAAGISIAGVTYGATGASEATIANKMADTVGANLDIRQQPAYADILEGACQSHMRTEGLITAVPHQLNFTAQEYMPGPIMHGHGHLLRGGSASTMDHRAENVIKNTTAPFVSGWVTGETAQRSRKYLDEWMKERASSDLRYLQYWAHHDLRCGVHLAPGILDYDSVNRMIYPLLDDAMVRIANRIPLFFKVRERTVFAAIRSMCEPLTKFQLYGEMWRFEKDKEEIAFPGRDMRATAIDKNHTPPTGGGLRYIGCSERPADQSAASMILESRIYKTIQPMLTDRMQSVVTSIATGLGLPEPVRSSHLPAQGSARRKLMEIFAICALFESQWLRPYRPARSPEEMSVTR